MQNKVAGRVIIDGTGRGIADLLVVIYDIDPASYAQSGVRPPSDNPSGDDPIGSLYTSPAARAWLDFPGDRIGSVLTDRRGWFELEFDDDAFRIRNDEKRPDLVLFILGPDRAPGLPISTRLLHYAFVARANAGRIEHYIVSIGTDALRSKGVHPGGTGDVVEGMRRDLLGADRIRTETATMIRDRLGASAPRRERLRLFRDSLPARLLGASLPLRHRYVERGAPVAEAHRDAVVAGVTRVAAASPEFRISMRVPTAELAPLDLDGARLDAGDSVVVSICDLLAQKGFGRELTRVRGLLDEKHAQDAMAHVVAPSAPADPTVPLLPPVVDTSDPSGYLVDRVLGQVAELPPMLRNESSSTIQELQKIKDTISKLELSGGPANVTAFHDLLTLQVAFEDVWTASFDASVRDQVLELYRQTTALHDEYGLELPPLEEVADANALRDYLGLLRGELSELEIIPIPADVQECFPQLEVRTWNQLTDAGRRILMTVAHNHLMPLDSVGDLSEPPSEWATQEYLQEQYQSVIRYQMDSPLGRAEALILDLAERLNEPYAFRYYAPGTINYGIMVTYRQEWMPETYQVGRLVSTIPLAPGENRKLKVTRTVKKTRAEKAIEKALLESTAERQYTSRTELEVMSKVMSTTNFRMSVTGSFNIGIGEIENTTEFSNNQQTESTQQKKQFLEAVQKSAERVRQESEITVESTESSEAASEANTELTNPNNELTVTYLLYELERRYRVTSRPHRLTPVVMVAVDIPAPHEITEGWILEHAWIIHRILLDDRFADALSYIEDGLSADAIDIEIKKVSWDTQRDLVAELESELEGLLALRQLRQDSIVGLMMGEGIARAGEMDDGARVAAAIFSGGLSELFGGGSSDRDEKLKAQREATEKALEFLKSRIEALSDRLSGAQKSLSEAANAYSAAVKEKAQKDTKIRQLRLHLRQNILHYVHGILDYKHPDQQFFEYNDLEVPFLGSDTRTCTIRLATPDEISEGVPGIMRDGDPYVVTCSPPVPPSPSDPLPMRRLGEIADLNRTLGYKGNYIIFPLKECSHLTDYMSREFVDDYFGLRDPATRLGYTGEELLAYAGEVLNDPTSRLTEEERTDLLQAVANELSNPSGSGETVILPTGQLYMEALKGEQSLLESFKLAHRGMDVLKVQEEVREKRLENLRRASRLVADEPHLEDPEIDRMVVVKGIDSAIVPVTDG